MKNIALIPLRGGSKSIPKKNIKPIAGKPLCAWVLEAAYESGIFNKIVVSTDSVEIAEIVSKIDLGVEIIKRPEHLATDEASTESVMLHTVECFHFDVLTTIQATSPLTTSENFINAYKKFKAENFDSLLTAVRVKRFFWSPDGTPLNYDPANRPRRQDFQGAFMENGAFYITRRDVLDKYKSRLGGKIGIYEMPEETSLEIDEPEDWEAVEALLKKRNIKDILERLKKLKLLAFDCDGVLTDAGMYYSESGEEFKKFNTRDGQGLELIRKKGIKTALITRENSKAAGLRAKKLKVDDTFIGIKDKTGPMRQLKEKYSFNSEDIAYVGDDIGDLPAMEEAGISFAVRDAVDKVKNKADFVLESAGGEGAIREVCEMILKSKE